MLASCAVVSSRTIVANHIFRCTVIAALQGTEYNGTIERTIVWLLTTSRLNLLAAIGLGDHLTQIPVQHLRENHHLVILWHGHRQKRFLLPQEGSLVSTHRIFL